MLKLLHRSKRRWREDTCTEKCSKGRSLSCPSTLRSLCDVAVRGIVFALLQMDKGNSVQPFGLCATKGKHPFKRKVQIPQIKGMRRDSQRVRVYVINNNIEMAALFPTKRKC